MDVMRFFSPTESDVFSAAGAGFFTSLLVTRQFGWWQTLSAFFAVELTSYFFLVPFFVIEMWSMAAARAGAFAWGLVGMLCLGAILSFAKQFHDDPQGTFSWVWRLVRGQTGGDK